MKSRSFFLICGLIALLAIPACQTDNDNWTPAIFAPSPESAAITRGQAKDTIKCESTRFRGFVCMPAKDLERLYQRCKAAARPWWQVWDE